MKYLPRLAFLLFLLPAVAGQGAVLSARQQSVIAPDLLDRLAVDAGGATFDVLVRFETSDRPSIRVNSLAASAGSLRDRYQRVSAHLRMAAATIPTITGNATVVRRFWIANLALVRLDRDALLALAERDDVTMIAPDATIELLQPVSIADAVVTSAGAAPNLPAIGARTLWARGLTGKGRLVASIDTGVEGIHPALSDRWRGLQGDTAASWFDPLNGPAPMDNNGHGTHVMGIMVGRAGADTIGVAPDAEWISAAVVDRGRSLSATFSDILAALEWVVDPDGNPATMHDVPDVVCNSWGVSQQIINPCNTMFFEAIDNAEAMGVVCIFAAGNEGPNAMTIRNPADRATSPTASFSVGAVDANLATFDVAGFSSRGPSACDGSAKKPEIVAPGVAIRSAYKGQTYRLINGTSMAAPHVAAAVALLRQYNSELTPEEIKTALLTTARDIGPAGEDNASGYGLLDLEAALASLPSPYYPVVTTGPVALDPAGDGVPALGETVELIVPVHANAADARNVTLNLASLCNTAQVLAGSAYLGTVPAGGSVDNASSPFVIAVSPQSVAGDTAWFEVSTSGEPLLSWWRDTIGVMVGLPEGAVVTSASAGVSALTVSNLGHLGLGAGSVLNAGGEGWRTGMIAADLLYEASLFASSGDGGWADASRQPDGTLRFDFAPLSASAFDDSHAAMPVGITVRQLAPVFHAAGDQDAVTLAWVIHNRDDVTIPGFQLGWVFDLDLPSVGIIDERVGFDASSGGFFHQAPAGEFVAGVAPLSGAFGGLRFFENNGVKTGLTDWQKRAALSGAAAAPLASGDFLAVASTAAVDLPPGDSIVIAIALIGAPTAGAFSAAARDAYLRWAQMSDAGDDQGGTVIPADFRLDQNYPNPFNAGTTIPVAIAGDGARAVRLEIIDLLGRRVRTLVDETMPPGQYPVFWNGCDDHGRALASGVYFSRLVIEGRASQARAMVLLK
jgi:subtilisin family serine protease